MIAFALMAGLAGVMLAALTEDSDPVLIGLALAYAALAVGLVVSGA